MRPGRIADPSSSAVVVLVAAIATAAATAVFVAGGLHPLVAPAASLPPSIPFTSQIATPEFLAAIATDKLLILLAVLAWAIVTVGLVVALSSWIDLAARRKAEVAVHRAVGASRRVLVRAALGQGLRLGLSAILAGLLVGAVIGRLGTSPWLHDDRGLLIRVATVAAIVLGGVTLGALAPLWAARTRRTVAVDEEPAPLGIGAGQLGLSLALIVAAGAVVDRGREPRATGRPLDPTGIITRLASNSERPIALDSLERLAQASGTMVSISLPGGHLGHGPVDELTTDCGQCYVGGIFLRFRPLRATYLLASADTFTARGITLTAGREFTDQDRSGATPVAIVNRHLAGRYFEGGNPIGRSVFPGGKLGGSGYRVIGVVDDPAPAGLGAGEQPRETVYLSTLQHPAQSVELFTTTPLPSIPGTTVVAARPADQLIRETDAPIHWFGGWFLALGVAVLALGVAGTAVLMTIWARSLRAEVGVRRAVGATRRDITRLVLGNAARVGLHGVALAITVFGPMLWPNLDLVAPGANWWQPRWLAVGAFALVACAIAGAVLPLRGLLNATPHQAAS